MPRDTIQDEAHEPFVLGAGGGAMFGTMRCWETFDDDDRDRCTQRHEADPAEHGDASTLQPSTSAAAPHPGTGKRPRRERSPSLDLLERRMRSAANKRKTTGETLHPSDDTPGQPLLPPAAPPRSVEATVTLTSPQPSLTPGPRTPHPRKPGLVVDLECLDEWYSSGAQLSPGEEGGSQFVPSPTKLGMHSTCSSEMDRVATPSSVSSAAPFMYPIFKAHTKSVYLVRHGESEYNAADAYTSKSFEEPTIFDAPLTAKGSMQARALGTALRLLPTDDIVWATSPLTRAMQTCLLAMEAAGRSPLADTTLGDESGASPLRVRPVTRQHTREQRHPVYVLSDLAEHLATSGDVGRPRATLQAALPQLAAQIKTLKHEQWWWAPEKNDHITQRFGSREPKESFRKRVGEFRRWVLSRPESNIVVFGHSTFFKELQGGHARRLANCEMIKIRV